MDFSIQLQIVLRFLLTTPWQNSTADFLSRAFELSDTVPSWHSFVSWTGLPANPCTSVMCLREFERSFLQHGTQNLAHLAVEQDARDTRSGLTSLCPSIPTSWCCFLWRLLGKSCHSPRSKQPKVSKNHVCRILWVILQIPKANYQSMNEQKLLSQAMTHWKLLLVYQSIIPFFTNMNNLLKPPSSAMAWFPSWLFRGHKLASDHHHADLVLLGGGHDLHGVIQDDVHELVIAWLPSEYTQPTNQDASTNPLPESLPLRTPTTCRLAVNFRSWDQNFQISDYFDFIPTWGFNNTIISFFWCSSLKASQKTRAFRHHFVQASKRFSMNFRKSAPDPVWALKTGLYTLCSRGCFFWCLKHDFKTVIE